MQSLLKTGWMLSSNLLSLTLKIEWNVADFSFRMDSPLKASFSFSYVQMKRWSSHIPWQVLGLFVWTLDTFVQIYIVPYRYEVNPVY